MADAVAPAGARNGGGRVQLAAGFSQMDWFRLAVRASDPAGRGGAPLRPITMAELRAHNNVGTDFWMALRGKVYNVTKYVPYHPGGAAELARALADDATALFDEVHPWVSESMINALEVGWLVADAADAAAAAAGDQTGASPKADAKPTSRAKLLARFAGRPAAGKNPAPPAVVAAAAGGGPAKAQAADQVESAAWVDCTLVAAEPSETKHCFWVRVRAEELSDEALEVASMPGVYIKLRDSIDDKEIERPFTPLLANSTIVPRPARSPGEFDLLVKLYADGVMTARLAQALSSADEPQLKLQLRRAAYRVAVVNGRFAMAAYGAASFRRAKPDVVIEHVCMIAQGTGVMPMLQILDFATGALDAAEDVSTPTFSMLLASRHEDEAPLRDELAQNHLLRDSLRLVLGDQGERISETLLNEHLAEFYHQAPSAESAAEPGLRIVICGSFEFTQAVQKIAFKAGWPASCIITID